MASRNGENNLFSYNPSLARLSSIRFYLFIATVILSLTVGLYWLNLENEKAEIRQHELSLISSVSSQLQNSFNEPINDLLVLSARLNELDSEQALNYLHKEFLQTAKVKKYYQQLRFLDIDGVEKIRLENKDKRLIVTSANDLQDKSQRYYYLAAKGLAQGEIYVSPMDLNVEYGMVEIPFRPQVRIVTPLYTKDAQPFGYVVINYAMSSLLAIVETHDQESVGELMLLNNDGYWLYSREQSLRWGFQLPHASAYKSMFATQWHKMQDANKNQLDLNNALITYRHLTTEDLISSSMVNGSNLQRLAQNSQANAHWVVVSSVNEAAIATYTASLRKISLVFALLALILLLPLSIVWGRRTARNFYNLERMLTFSQFVERSEDMVYVVDPKGKIIYVNSALERVSGYTVNEIVGQTPSLFKSGRHPEEFYQLLWETVRRGERFTNLFVNKRRDGSFFYEEKEITPILNAEGKVKYFVSMGRDLSRVYAMQTQKMQMTSCLSEGVTHQFNNLFGAIMGFMDLSLHRLKERDYRGAETSLEKSLNTLIRAQELTAKITKTSHRKVQNYPAINIRNVVQSVVDSFQSELRDDVSLSVKFVRELDDPCADTELIKTAVFALLENARQSFDHGGTILVSIDQINPVSSFCINCCEPINGEFIAINVEDSGEGIEHDTISRVFDPFFTTKESAHLVGKTPGLGLTMVRGIAHLHGGHVLLESEKSRGTSVTILLPLVVASAGTNDDHYETGVA